MIEPWAPRSYVRYVFEVASIHFMANGSEPRGIFSERATACGLSGYHSRGYD
jgi:hypothetical protein